MTSTERLEEKLDDLREKMFEQFTAVRKEIGFIKDGFTTHEKHDVAKFTDHGNKITLLIWIVGIISAAVLSEFVAGLFK